MSSPYAYLAHRGVLSLSGPDTIELLERLVTHNVKAWAPGETRYGALLTPQGKIIADYLALRTPEGVLLDVDKDALPDLAKRFKLFRLRAKVEIEVREDLFVIAGLEKATHGVRPISGALEVYLDPRYPGGRLRGLATRESWGAWYGYHPAEWSVPLDRYHADRIANGVAEQGADFETAKIFPADINMDIHAGVDMKKGCFVGQEVVSRMHRRGRIRKRTLITNLSPSNTPLSDVKQYSFTPKIGRISSVEGDQALAHVHLERLANALSSGDPIHLNETPVTIDIPAWLEPEMQALQEDDG
ncbi:MAG: folate-binding protein [Pseudomonadota bacterium]